MARKCYILGTDLLSNLMENDNPMPTRASGLCGVLPVPG